MNINIDQINAELLNYHRVYANKITTRLYRKRELEECMTDLPGVADEHIGTEAIPPQLLQGWQCDWVEHRFSEPTGNIQIVPERFWDEARIYNLGDNCTYKGLQYTALNIIGANLLPPDQNPLWDLTGGVVAPSENNSCIGGDGVGLSLIPVRNKVRPVMLRIKIKCLEKLHRTYLAFLASEELEPKAYPFVRYIIEKVLMPKIDEEIDTLSAIGEYSEPIPNVAGPYITSTDGLFTVKNRLISEGKVTPLVTGPLGQNTIFTQVEDFLRMVPSQYLKKNYPLIMSYSNRQKLFTNYRDTYARGGFEINGKHEIPLLDTMIPIKGVSSLDGTDSLLYTPKENMLRLYWKMKDVRIHMQQIANCILLWSDFKLGYGFENASKIFANEY